MTGSSHALRDYLSLSLLKSSVALSLSLSPSLQGEEEGGEGKEGEEGEEEEVREEKRKGLEMRHLEGAVR